MLDTVIGLDMRGDDARAAVRQVRLRGIGEGEYTWSLRPGGQREVEGRGGAFLLVRGAPLASYGLAARYTSAWSHCEQHRSLFFYVMLVVVIGEN